MGTGGRRATRWVALVAVVGALALLAVGCGSSGSAKASTGDTGSSGGGATSSTLPGTGQSTNASSFEIDAPGMSYTFPKATAPAGNVKVTLANHDKVMPHQAQLFVLHQGTTPEQFTKALLSPAGEGAVVSMADPAGGPNAIGPGGTASAMVDLQAGATYMVICAIPASDGKPHYAHGMIGHFSVSSTPGTAPAPAAKSTVTLSDFAFQLPSDVDWSAPIDVQNKGSEPHELAILAPATGKTVDDVKSALMSGAAGPPPYTAHGGVAAIAPGAHQVFTPDLDPGSYLLVCFVLDPKTMKPHYMLGMMSEVTVS